MEFCLLIFLMKFILQLRDMNTLNFPSFLISSDVFLVAAVAFWVSSNTQLQFVWDFFFYMVNDTKRFSPFNVVIADWFEFSNFHIFNHHFANHFSIFIAFFKWWKEDWEKRQKALIQIYGWDLQVIKMLKSWLKNALNLLCAIKDS